MGDVGRGSRMGRRVTEGDWQEGVGFRRVLLAVRG